ncbi:MAG TPA: hypothetical protein VKB93_20215 [Thermoanaerobaculia bacterium]|nr:hypothetical protein [Thermoanaerobaculia bacterium]
MMKTLSAAVLTAILAIPSLAQTPEPPPPPPESEAQKQPETPPATPPEQTPPAPPAEQPPAGTTVTPTGTAAQPSVLSEAASGSYERRESLPAVNLYLPEMQASVRLRKLIKNVLFESQIDYEFINGDISTFLRYKYYARNYTYRIGVFDAIDFPDITSDDSTREFERVRGGLFLLGVPRDYNNRWFFLLENDSLSFGDINRPDNRKNNLYTKIGYQYGTQFDERMNAIVGEQRGRLTPVLTAFREIGPQKTGLAAAITQSVGALGADYTYTKFEAEGLRRFDVSSTTFVFSRLHVGTFLARDETDPPPVPRDRNGDQMIDEKDVTPQWEFFDIPQSEFFRLGGREALKSIKSNDDSLGTHEVHLTNEYFFPIFRNKNYHLGPLAWNTLYGIAYLGAGAASFKSSELVKSNRIVVDAGIGTEHAITFRDWDIYLSVIYAKAITKPDEIDEGNGFRFAIRTVR